MQVKFLDKIKAILEEAGARLILILCHQNADPDAICSAFALSRLLKHLWSEAKVEAASPESVSKLSRTLLERYSMKVINEEPPLEKADVIFMLDTNTLQQLGDWSAQISVLAKPIIVIDHHVPHPETEKTSKLYICQEVSSTCEIVYSLFKEADLKPSKDVAEALFLGIAFDTKHFALANTSTFKVVTELVDSGIDAQESLQLLMVPMEISERIARLKACKRAKLMRVNNWLIVFSHVSSFQASAARTLVEAGANVAIVGGQNKNELTICIRSDQEFYNKTKMHLGRDLANPLGEYLHGMGGGHSTSAGVNGFGDLEDAFRYAKKILLEKLKGSQS